MSQLKTYCKGVLISLLIVSTPFWTHGQDEEEEKSDLYMGGQGNFEWGLFGSKTIGGDLVMAVKKKRYDIWGAVGFNVTPEYQYKTHSLEVKNEVLKADGYKKASSIDLTIGYRETRYRVLNAFDLYFGSALNFRFGKMTIRNEAPRQKLESMGIQEERTERVGDLYLEGETGFSKEIGRGFLTLGFRSSLGLGNIVNSFIRSWNDAGQVEEDIDLEEDFRLPFNYSGPLVSYTF